MNTENNKLIAEFMRVDQIDVDTWLDKEELKYHSSWDWLMPVVRTIETECQGVPQELLYLSLYSEFREVYEAVVQFIKEHK